MAVPTPDQIAKQFTAHYQPIVDLNTGIVSGFEALARIIQAAGSIATAARMLRGIVTLAAALRLRTVAEGVETWEEAFFLRAAGIDCGQGWFWSKAVPAPEAARALSEGYPLGQARPG